MAQPGRRQHPFWDVVPLETLAVALGVLIALSIPLAPANRALNAVVLGLVASAEPPRSVIAITLTSADTRLPDCRVHLEQVLRGAGAPMALVVPPADELCGHDLEAPTERSVSAEPFVAVLEPGLLRTDPAGNVLGFVSRANARPLAERLGVFGSEWVAARPAMSVPSLNLGDLAAERVPNSVVQGRLAVVGIESASWNASSENGRSTLHQVTAGLGAALDDGPRFEAPKWFAALLVLVLGSVLSWMHRRRGMFAALGTLACAVFAAFAGNALHIALGGPWLLHHATIASGLVGSGTVLVVPRVLAAWRAVHRATELMERAALIRTQSVHTIPDAEFWVRVASLAGQAHPSDGVLVAELPPHRWHLRFWPNGSMGENLVAERRRDIRRAPYCDDNGVPAIRIAHNYLAMKGVPALVIPLIAFGDVEGYVFLCGARAEQAYLAQPELAERLGNDLGLLLRRRRLGSLREDDWRRTAGGLVQQPERRTLALIEGARVALDDLRLFGSVLREAPVGLLFADAFADVRLVGKEFARWLPALGLGVETHGGDGQMPPGQLGLARILKAVSNDFDFSVAGIARKNQPTVRRVQVQSELGFPCTLELSVRALVNETEGERSIVGYVASVLEIEEHRAPVLSLEQAAVSNRDSLMVLSLSDLLGKAARATLRRTGRPVRVETPRFSASAIVQGQALSAALEDFLCDAIERSPSGHGPVLAARERRHHVQIDIMDLANGVPESAFKRTVKAPGAAPPEGLEAFAALVAAVEDSHGYVLVQGSEGWGMQISLRLVRAKTPVRVPESDREGGSVTNLRTYTRRGRI